MMTEVVEKWSGGKKSFFGRQLDFFFLILVETDRFLSLLKRCLCVNQIYLLTRGVFFSPYGDWVGFFFLFAFVHLTCIKEGVKLID